MSDELLREQRLSELAHDFSTRVRRGEQPLVEEFALAHPDLAEEIRELFPSIEVLESRSSTHSADSLGLIPARLSEFTIVRKIGQGGMGQVFEAIQESLGRRVALKILHVQSTDESLVARFSREAQVVARLHHTNIVPIYSFGEHGGIMYFAMQFIDGWPLSRVIEQSVADGTCSRELLGGPHRVSRLGVDMASALAEAHACGVTHRDVKPANMLLDHKGKLWLTDFGLAQLQDASDLTGPNDMLGTMRYMPPERLSGGSSKLGDIYGLGISLYEILAGRPAYVAKDRSQLIHQILHESPPHIKSLNAAVPGDLATIIHKCMEKLPSDRYQSALQMQEDLERFCADQPICARRLSPMGIALRWSRRNRLLAGSLATTVLAIVVMAIVSTIFLFRENGYNRALESAIDETEKGKQRELMLLFGSIVDSAHAQQLALQPGQRFESLKKLHEAKELLDKRLQLSDNERRTLIAELRDIAVAGLSLIDVHALCQLPNNEKCVGLDTFRGDRYFYQLDPTTVVCRNFDNRVLYVLPSICAKNIVLATPDPTVVLIVDRERQTLSRRRIDESSATLVAQLSDMALEYHLAEFNKDGAILLLKSYTDINAMKINVFDLSTSELVLHLDDIPNFGDSTCYLSPDGSKVALSHGEYGTEESKALNLVDIATGEESTLAVFDESISSTAWYPDSKTLAIGLTDSNRIEWWDVPERKMLQFIESQNGGGPALSCNTTGEWLYSYARWTGQSMFLPAFSDTSKLNTTNFRPILTRKGNGRYIGGQSIDDHSYELWEAIPSPVVRTLTRHPARGEAKRMFASAIHPHGRILAVGSDNGVSIFDIVTGMEIQCLEIGQCNYPFFVPQTGDLLANSKSGLHRWKLECDSQTGGLLTVSEPQILLSESAFGMQVASDVTGNLLANAYGNKVFLSRELGQTIEAIDGFDDCRFVSLSPDGKWLVTSPHVDSQSDVTIWDTTTRKPVKSFPKNGGSHVVRFSPDGKWLSLGDNEPSTVSTDDWQSAPVMSRLLGSHHVFSHDSRLVLSFYQGRIALQDTSTGERLCFLAFPLKTSIDHWMFSPDGNLAILTSNQALSVYVWDLQALQRELKALDMCWESEAISETLDESNARPTNRRQSD